MNQHGKVAGAILIFMAIAAISLITHSGSLQRPVTIYADEEEDFRTARQQQILKHSAKLVNGPWPTTHHFLLAESEQKPTNLTLSEINTILWDYWNSKEHGDSKSFHGGGKAYVDAPQQVNSADFTFGTDLEHWVPDWYSQPDSGAVLKTRMSNILSRCKTYKGERNIWRRRVSHVYPHAGSLTYCATAKAGSTFWKNVMRTLSKNRGKRWGKQKRSQNVDFTTVRNPWHRLVSTYLEKFAPHTSRWKRHRKTFCRLKLIANPTFREFVHDCVLDMWRHGIHNQHWMPSMERCELCEKGEFDYAVAVENMMPEGAYVLSQVDIENPDGFLQKVRDSSIRPGEKKQVSKNYQEYYNTLDILDLKQLQDMFAIDIYVLQYPHSPFVDFKKS